LAAPKRLTTYHPPLAAYLCYDYRMKPQAKKLLQELEFLFENYSNELRATTQPYHLAKIKNKFTDYEYHPDDEVIRETLMEHVGSLPMLATAMYPFINDDEVDLGRALTMLAIHDIGELITGDENVFTKNPDSKQVEREAALKLLHKSYHDMFDEMENQASRTAKFAKAIDKINPDIIDYLAPADVTIVRYKGFAGTETTDEIIELIVKFKRPYMTWNPFMTEFHKLLMEELEKKLQGAK
jgi:HD domain-containing protein